MSPRSRHDAPSASPSAGAPERSRVRVGIVDYLNAWPPAWGLLQGDREDLFACRCELPAQVARLLAAGELDIGLIPSVEVLRIPGLRVVPGACVAADREVRSVLLVSRRPINRVERVALDLNSRTSATLVRILFEDRFGTRPELIQRPPRLDEMLEEADAALIIGDPALQVSRRAGHQVWDLAAEWRAMTGLPFVFAVWAAREGVEVDDLVGHFRRSLERGMAELPAIEREAVDRLGLDPEVVHRYLTENLRFELGPEELLGLEEFYRRARGLGLVPAEGRLRFVEG